MNVCLAAVPCIVAGAQFALSYATRVRPHTLDMFYWIYGQRHRDFNSH